MVARIEVGKTGVRFASIERLANALEVDPAELFIADPDPSRTMRGPLLNVTARLSRLSDRELAWIDMLLDAALSPRG